MSSLDIAPHPEGAPARVQDRRRMRRPFRRAGICTIWRLGFRQFSFHRIARVPRRAVPDTWTRPPVSCHALVPLTFRRQVRHRTQGHPSNPSRLNRGYNEAPRGAPLSCRHEVHDGSPRARPDSFKACGDCYGFLAAGFPLTWLRMRAGISYWWQRASRPLPSMRFSGLPPANL
jgi:hypothetical protein